MQRVSVYGVFSHKWDIYIPTLFPRLTELLGGVDRKTVTDRGQHKTISSGHGWTGVLIN